MKDKCDYVYKCVSKLTEDCIPNYEDCMIYKFYKLKENDKLETVGDDE